MQKTGLDMMYKRTFHQYRAFRLIASAAVALLTAWPATAHAQEMTIAPQFESAGNFHHGVAAAKENGLWGFIDKAGNWVVKPTYQGVTVGGDGLFGVELGGQWGYVDAKGAMVIQPQYEAVGPFEGAVAPAKLNGLWGYITPNGKVDIPFEFPELGGREDDLLAARTREGWTILKRYDSGEWSSLYYDPNVIRYYSISEKAVVAKLQDGEKLVSPEYGGGDSGIYLSIMKRSQGFSAASRSKGKWGYLDKNREYLWPDRFEEAGQFTESLAPVKTAGKWGYIDRGANFIVAPSYDAAFPFRDGLAVVRTGELRGFLKNDSQRGIYEFIKPVYQDAYRFTEGLAPVKVGDKWGYVSSGRQPLLPDVVDIEAPQ